MKVKNKFCGHFSNLATSLLILLFVYAALAKLMDFEKFRIQLGQSPLLTRFAAPVAWAVPIAEIAIAAGLCFARTRAAAFFASFALLAVFTSYIVAIMAFSEFVPCSCGGILQGLGWGQHLVFNIFFLAIAGISSLMDNDHPNDMIKPG